MLVAIADPPYVGQAARHYADHPDYAGEVDHAELIEQLVTKYPDGWVLCCSSPSLRQLLPLCPGDTRIGAWVKPFCAWKDKSVAYAWEPVLFRGGRKKTKDQDTTRDWVSASIVLRNHNGTKGSKPEAFSFWCFELLGLQAGDTLDDLFPGSGAITVAWERYQQQLWTPSVQGLEQEALL